MLLLSDEKYKRHSCKLHDHETEYELFLKHHHRRLDRKSSRGMIYENEELRLRTININAEIERGQYDIKKLKRENELLKKEIWCLRDEYEKLDKLLKEKQIDFSSSSTTSDSESNSGSSCESEEAERNQNQNIENVQKTNLKNLHRTFEALSVVQEESSDNSNRTSANEQLSLPNDVLTADQSYPATKFSGAPSKIPSPPPYQNPTIYIQNSNSNSNYINSANEFEFVKGEADVIIKMENEAEFPKFCTGSRSTFSNGGNLEELLNDIETISQDILAISNVQQQQTVESITENCKNSQNGFEKPFKSELNVTLMPQMPQPMELLGLEKYAREIKTSIESLISNQAHPIAELENIENVQKSDEIATYLNSLRDNYVDGNYFARYHPENYQFEPNETDNSATKNDQIAKEKEENDERNELRNETSKSKVGLRKKVSIHFRGKKEKEKAKLETQISSCSSSANIKKHSPTRDKNLETHSQRKMSVVQKASSCSESDTKKHESDKKKSSSNSPDRRKVEKKSKKHKKDHRNATRQRRETIASIDSRENRARSRSVGTERSNTYNFSHFLYDDSERESLSSLSDIKNRQINFSNIPHNGKVPWCGCWGNGCI